MSKILVKSITWDGKRRRQLHRENVEQIKESIETEGLKVPLIVRKNEDGTIKGIAGLHRWTALTELEISRVEVTFQLDQGDQELNDIDDAMTEIDENLIREGLTEVEENAHVAEREQLHIQRAAAIERQEAELRKAEADQAVKEAKGKKAKAKAKQEQDAARTARVKANRKRLDGSEKGSQVKSRKGVQAATKEAKKITGKGERVIRQKKQNSTALEEVCKAARVMVDSIVRSSLDTPTEQRNLAKLFKVQPEAAKRVVKQAARGDQVSATKELAKVKRAATESAKEARRTEKGGQYREIYQTLAPALTSINNTWKLAESFKGAPGMRALASKLGRMHKELQLQVDGCREKAELETVA